MTAKDFTPMPAPNPPPYVRSTIVYGRITRASAAALAQLVELDESNTCRWVGQVLEEAITRRLQEMRSKAVAPSVNILPEAFGSGRIGG